VARAHTADEVREKLLSIFSSYVSYWNSEDGSNVLPQTATRTRLEGLVHSVLCVLDGCTAGAPGFDIVAKPHADDKAICQQQGVNWYEDGTVANTKPLHKGWYNALNASKQLKDKNEMFLDVMLVTLEGHFQLHHEQQKNKTT
jgi:hypothetical protein